MKQKITFVFALIMVFKLVVPTFAQESGYQIMEDVPKAVSISKGDGTYIIRMIDNPVVAYEGGIDGLKPTKPEKGEKINPNNAHVKEYLDYLIGKHDAALDAVDAKDNKVYSYGYSFNGFAASLTGAQADALSTRADVVGMWADELNQLETDNSPDFLGLTADGGLWDLGYDGEGVIIGVIDTGIWPEHPSFSDRTGSNGNETKDEKLDYLRIPGWYGRCVPGEAFDASDCNNKLIGARYYAEGFLRLVGSLFGDYYSARDREGHGSHTASTAGGNAGVQASIFGVNRGTVSGIAPRARIAAYKACWGDVGCVSSDLVAAIDQAVADGVDVINYSIGSVATTPGADDLAFLFAADAGVFVATSAGNSGPVAQSIGSPAWNPWLTSVGASTQDRTFQGSVELGSGAGFFGASVTGGTDVLPLVDSEAAALDPDDEDAVEDAELCIPGALDPGVVAGKIVLCLRAEIARVDKSRAVYMAGGAGTILYNASDLQSQNTDNHWTPAVHINNTDGLAVKAYIDGAGESATARINGGVFTTIDAPWIETVSSRGPNGGAMDIIKPDITAPGVNILAANSPTPFIGAPGQLFQAIGGTSMSSPHVAGAFALLKQAHPDWTPAMAKSALMTTAYQDVMKEDGVTPADPFDMGAGHLNPTPAVDPGLVYDAGFLDYLGFLCGNNPVNISQGACDFLVSLGIPTDPSDLNYPSIAVAELTGIETIRRTVTSVTPGTATYSVSAVAPPGVSVAVSPSSLTLDEGESAGYSVTFTTLPGATLDEWTFGSITWSHGPHSVRSPIAVKPVVLTAPDEVAGTGTDGSLSFDVIFGYGGAYTAAPHGLNPATITSDTVVQDPDQRFDPDDGFSNLHQFALSGAVNFRIAIPPDATEEGAGLGIFVFDPDGNLVASSISGGTDNLIDIPLPVDGTWDVWVHGFVTPGGDSNYDMYTWALSATPGGSLTIDSAPASATIGATETINVSWAGAAAGSWWLGAVSHSDAGGVIDLTLVNIDNR